MRKHLAALIVGAALLMGSSSAWALPYTIAASVPFSGNGLSGSINPVTDLSGAPICLNGVCSVTATQDWLAVSVTLNGGSDAVDRLDMSVAGVSAAVGMGHFGEGQTPTLSSLLTSPTQARFDYGNPNVSALNLQAGETTGRLFVAFSLGSLPGAGIPPVIPAGTASFMIGEVGGANVVSVTGLVVPVPEAGTLLLLGGGCLGLGLAGRRRR